MHFTNGPQEAFLAAMTSPEFEAIMTNAMAAYQNKFCEFAPEICRQIFKFIDIDNSGTITRREVTVMKSVMDGFLRLGTLCGEGGMSAEDRAEMSRIYPDVFVLPSGQQVLRPVHVRSLQGNRQGHARAAVG